MIWENKYQDVVNTFTEIGINHHHYMYQCYQDRAFPLVAWRELGKNGLFNAMIQFEKPEALKRLSAAYEGFSYGSQDLAFGIAPICHGAMAVPIINEYASKEAKEKYLADATSGKSIISFAVTESTSGGTNAFSNDCHLASYNGKKILNGKKWHITSAPYADLIMCWAKDDYGSLVAVLVESEFDGVFAKNKLNCSGARSSPVGSIEFKNVIIPTENIIRFKCAKRTLSDTLIVERVIGTFAGIGIIKLMIEKCVRFVRTRSIGGVKLERHQFLQHRITKMQSKLTQLEALSHSTLDLLVSERNVDLESSVLKPLAAEFVFDCAKEAGLICASYGLQEEAQFYSALLDAWAAMIGGGTEEAHKMIVWNKMKKKYNSGRSISIDNDNRYIWDESEEILEEVKKAI